MIQQHMWTINYVKAMRPEYGEWEDGLLSLIRAARYWSPDKRTKFGTFAIMTMRQAAAKWLTQRRRFGVALVCYRRGLRLNGNGQSQDDDDDAQHLAAAFGQIAPGDAHLLRLRFWDALTYRAIARHLGCSASLARFRVLRSVQVLREQIKEHGDG